MSVIGAWHETVNKMLTFLNYQIIDSATYDWLQSYGNLRHLLSTESLLAAPSIGCSSHHHKSFHQQRLTIDDSSTQTNKPLPYFPSYKDCRVLILGCGNSTLAEEMRNDGWCGTIVNLDFSTVVIDQMKRRYSQSGLEAKDMEHLGHAMKFICADITDGIPFENESFDLIICKGTFDAILCGVGLVDAKKVVAECARVLTAGYGCLFLVSYSNPDSRVEFLEHEYDLSYYWHDVSFVSLPRPIIRPGAKTSYVYICRKQWAAVPFGQSSQITKTIDQSDEENLEATRSKK
ncbi:methyltransferase domain containing protein [Nitzschia inconspicua]|uniref:Methyltransferase domain containing protein n=1 Tax=Nitzschia inconspicua TaxID=303405 RepID=A0A9K3KJ37_9STRA|nr:methyltransferase domain containing protein [Nitzschia inconspicua]KAG7337040.1 methyltransferase domain containing protein [Nitzschia inconspicua]KAG7344672.1 methyltransferase domain containing protein [Nitzschia inconspicua]